MLPHTPCSLAEWACISENRRGQYWYLKQLSIHSRRHPSDKMIKRSAFQTTAPTGQQRCRVQALVWLHLSGHISSEKSLPTLGRKISKENHPPLPPALVWTALVWTVFQQTGEENRAELSHTAGHPLTFYICSCRKKPNQNRKADLWEWSLRAVISFQRAPSGLPSLPLVRCGFGKTWEFLLPLGLEITFPEPWQLYVQMIQQNTTNSWTGKGFSLLWGGFCCSCWFCY